MAFGMEPLDSNGFRHPNLMAWFQIEDFHFLLRWQSVYFCIDFPIQSIMGSNIGIITEIAKSRLILPMDA